jgi:hypothetical protein
MDTHLLAITGFVDGSRDCKPDAAKKKKEKNSNDSSEHESSLLERGKGSEVPPASAKRAGGT